jgi:hypothetical protein
MKFAVVKGHEESTVILLQKPAGFPNIIHLNMASQKELEYLFSLNHPFVYKVEAKPEPKPEIKKE